MLTTEPFFTTLLGAVPTSYRVSGEEGKVRPPVNLWQEVESEGSWSPGWRPQARKCLERRVRARRFARYEAWSGPGNPHGRGFPAVLKCHFSRHLVRSPRDNHSYVQRPVPVKLGRFLPCIAIGYCFDSHLRMDSIFQKLDFAVDFLRSP